MFKKIFRGIIDFIKEEYVFLITMIVITIVCTYPVDYYIIVGGGISDVSDRINVSDGYDSKGSFNLSYVTELKGTTVSYLLSYIIPSWEKVPMADYKYSSNEDYNDINFRGDINLKNANSVAIKNAYSLAGRKCDVKNNNIYVVAVFPEYKSNLKIRDKIISINGFKADSLKEYQDYIQKLDINKPVKVKVNRDGKDIIVNNKLNDFKGRKILGVSLDYYYDLDISPKVKFKFKHTESGPSAGLITTLEIYNQLTKKDLTKGYTIAGTGTILENGDVGSIGGVSYKLMGAVEGKADLFLVPAGENYKEAVKTKKNKNLDIDIYEVHNVKEAIGILNNL